MKAKSASLLAFLALALLVFVAPVKAEAQCCWGDAIAAPFVAAGAIVEGAVVVSAAIVTAPFTALSCGSCGINLCNPCGSAPVSYAPGNYGRY
jgi:hypothetical protein